MKIKDIFKLDEPKRTLGLEAVSATDPIDVYSEKSFPVRYMGEIKQIKAGKNSVSKDYGLYLLRKYPGLSEDPLDGSDRPSNEPEKSEYFKALVDVKGIGAKTAEEIEKAYPSPAELVESIKSGGLDESFERFSDALLEAFNNGR